MKLLSGFLLFSSGSAGQVKTLFERPSDDRKVPTRHPLQRLWRLYQFSEEIIQQHFLHAGVMSEKKINRLRNRIGTWQYMAMRQSYLKGIIRVAKLKS